jgi:hypothetical protein
MTAKDGGNAKRLLGTIFAIHVGNEEDGQKDKPKCTSYNNPFFNSIKFSQPYMISYT